MDKNFVIVHSDTDKVTNWREGNEQFVPNVVIN